MFKYLIPLFLCLFTFPGTRVLAQNQEVAVPVANSLHSLQTDLNGLFYVHERGLNEELTLRIEAGIKQAFRTRTIIPVINVYSLRPVVTIEPRYYYNLAKRAAKEKNTDNNSGNFVGFAASYEPDFVFNSDDNSVRGRSVLTLMPHWGIRRQLGRHFDFEFTAGLKRSYTKTGGSNQIVRGNRCVDLGVRFGYRF